jgi:hypothetical protein
MFMEHPKIETLNKSIVGWIQKSFVKALIPHHIHEKDFKFVRVRNISRVWKDNDYWTVEATIEFSLGEAKSANIVFQVDSEGNIMGYNVPKMDEI